MDFSEFVLFLVSLVLVCGFSGVLALARSENPERLYPLLFFVSAVVIISTAVIGLVCYAVAWFWRNPLIAMLLLAAGILGARYLARQGKLEIKIWT